MDSTKLVGKRGEERQERISDRSKKRDSAAEVRPTVRRDEEWGRRSEGYGRDGDQIFD